MSTTTSCVSVLDTPWAKSILTVRLRRLRSSSNAAEEGALQRGGSVPDFNNLKRTQDQRTRATDRGGQPRARIETLCALESPKTGRPYLMTMTHRDVTKSKPRTPGQGVCSNRPKKGPRSTV